VSTYKKLNYPVQLTFENNFQEDRDKAMKSPHEENLAAITPEGMYVYAERVWDRSEYRLHIHSGKDWYVCYVSRSLMSHPNSVKSLITNAIVSDPGNTSLEFVRRCAAQRESLLRIAKQIDGDEFNKLCEAMHWDPTESHDVKPHEEIKTIYALEKMIKDDIEELHRVRDTESIYKFAYTPSPADLPKMIINEEIPYECCSNPKPHCPNGMNCRKPT